MTYCRNTGKRTSSKLLTLTSGGGCGAGSCTMYRQMWAVWSPEAVESTNQQRAQLTSTHEWLLEATDAAENGWNDDKENKPVETDAIFNVVELTSQTCIQMLTCECHLLCGVEFDGVDCAKETMKRRHLTSRVSKCWQTVLHLRISFEMLLPWARQCLLTRDVARQAVRHTRYCYKHSDRLLKHSIRKNINDLE